MRLLDFGDSATFPITAFDSRASLAPLMRQTDVARAIVMHLPPDGVVGSHEATTHQLFCVVAGEGWVAGADDVRVPIRTWQAGERHTSGTESGMVAVVVEGEFETELPPA